MDTFEEACFMKPAKLLFQNVYTGANLHMYYFVGVIK